MTDPNATSDDILSSIRRLVVDEERAGASAVQPARQKLVLTPNLRVVSSTSRPQTAAALQPLHLQNPPRAGLTTPQFVASVAQGINPQAMDWEPETEAEVPEIDSLDLARFAQARSAQTTAPQDGEKVELPFAQQPVLPEQVLRDLVRDLVREQFQGDLGLHITRNIRKLVKSEIARELALREKD